MSLYVPAHFQASDDAWTSAIIRAHPFATLITSNDADVQVSHLPLGLGSDGTLTGHMARANPHWRYFAVGRTLAIFHGPHAYVSPSWYEAAPRNVPTWNYAVVHVHGTPVTVDDAAAVSAQMGEMVQTYEGDGPAVWRFDAGSTAMQAMMRGIVAFRMPIERLEAKFKLSQNRASADRTNVMRALRASGQPDAVAVADLMSRSSHL